MKAFVEFDLPDEFIARVKELIDSKNINRSHLAKRLGISRNNLYPLLNGAFQTITLDRALILEEVLESDLEVPKDVVVTDKQREALIELSKAVDNSEENVYKRSVEVLKSFNLL